VLVWQDLAGLTPGRPAKFVKRYAEVGSVLSSAVREWADEVVAGEYPGPEHQYS
jgi:3-methyl-2-oxobutanoate hydroxymethyltransferase